MIAYGRFEWKRVYGFYSLYDSINRFDLHHCCAYPKPENKFLKRYIVILFLNLKLLGFQIFWFWLYLKKVILEMHRAH
jgi:hypothetical protein